MNVLALIRAMRPHQWIKNVFVLAALFFSIAAGESDLGRVRDTLFALAAFCFGSSTIYLLNDVMDVERDRAHPTKKNRPIASGEVSVQLALAASAMCLASALALAWRANPQHGTVALVVGSYMTINFFYSWKLKHIVLLDAFCIASGFLLRVLAGGIASEAAVSHWLMLCTLFLALFLAFGKRHAEIGLLGDDRGGHRKILLEYTPELLNQLISVLAACTIVCYTMYTVSAETVAKFGHSQLVWTVPFVVFGLFRYLLLVRTRGGGGSPSRVLLGGDVAFVINALLWLGTVSLLLFFGATPEA